MFLLFIMVEFFFGIGLILAAKASNNPVKAAFALLLGLPGAALFGFLSLSDYLNDAGLESYKFFCVCAFAVTLASIAVSSGMLTGTFLFRK